MPIIHGVYGNVGFRSLINIQKHSFGVYHNENVENTHTIDTLILKILTMFK